MITLTSEDVTWTAVEEPKQWTYIFFRDGLPLAEFNYPPEPAIEISPANGDYVLTLPPCGCPAAKAA